MRLLTAVCDSSTAPPKCCGFQMLCSFVSAHVDELMWYRGAGPHTLAEDLHSLGFSSAALRALWLSQAERSSSHMPLGVYPCYHSRALFLFLHMLTSSPRLGKCVSAMPVKSSPQALEILSLYRLTSQSHCGFSVPLLSADFL